MHVESWQSCINDRFYFVGCLPRLSFVVFYTFFFLLIHLLIQHCTFSSFANILSLPGGISVSQDRDVVCTRALLCTLGSLSLVTHPRDSSAPSDHQWICRAMCYHFLVEAAVRSALSLLVILLPCFLSSWHAWLSSTVSGLPRLFVTV